MSLPRCLLCLAALLVTGARESWGFEIINEPHVNVTERLFDQATFGSLLIDGARRKCHESLLAYVEFIEKAISMDAGQAQKLVHAGEVDIHRFFQTHAAIKRSLNFRSLPRDEVATFMNRIRVEASPLKRRYETGLHAEGSLLEKVLRSVFDAEQIEALEVALQKRRLAEYSGYVKVTLASLDRRAPLMIRQREKITKLLLEKTSPPLHFGSGLSPIMAVLIRMGEIEEDLKEIYTEPDWVVVDSAIRRARLTQ